MATRQKTVQFAFPALASLVNNTLTNLTQITVYLPESSKTFRSVTAQVSFDDIITVTGGTLTTKTLELRLAAVGYSSVANANVLANSGNNASFLLTADYTSYFNTNWSGSSMTCDFRLQINQSTGTTLGMVNVCVILEITYDYDDTSTTHIKTVVLPLNAPVGALSTTPTTYDTVPAIGYYLPESTKTFRNIFVVVEGTEGRASATTDHTLSLAIGAASTTTGNYEGALATDRRFRYVWELSASWPSTTATQTFQLSDTVGRNHHLQAWLVITYEFKANAATTTLSTTLSDGTGTSVDVADATKFGTVPYLITIENEQMLVTSVASNTLTVTRAYNGTTGVSHTSGVTVYPCLCNSVQLIAEHGSISGGTTSSDYQRFTTRLYVEEPGPITGNKIAFNLNFPSQTDVAGLNVRVGTGSFVTYTDASNVVAGTAGLMCRNDSAFTLARGLNTLTFDVYRTDTSFNDMMWGMSGYWVLTYISSQPSSGAGVANKTVRWNIATNGTSGTQNTFLGSATAPNLPEADYYISNCGMYFLGVPTGANSIQITGLYLAVERLAAEGGVRWDTIINSHGTPDAEIGPYHASGSLTRFIKRWPADTGFERFDLETSRRYRWQVTLPIWTNLCLWYTYHNCGPFTVSGNVSNSDAGTVTIGLHRSSDGELLKSTTRAGDGSYSFNWHDNTENVFTEATDVTGNCARSQSGVATGSP